MPSKETLSWNLPSEKIYSDFCHMLEGTPRTNLVQPSCSKQCQLQHVTKDHVQLSSECLQGWRLHKLLGHLFQYSTNLAVKKVF